MCPGPQCADRDRFSAVHHDMAHDLRDFHDTDPGPVYERSGLASQCPNEPAHLHVSRARDKNPMNSIKRTC